MSIVNNIENTENLMNELVTPVGTEIKVEVISPEEMDDDDFEPGGKYPSDEYICWLKHFLQKVDDEKAEVVITEKIEKLTEQMKKNPFWFNAMDMVYMGLEVLLDKHTLEQCKILMQGPYSEIYVTFAEHYMKEK